MTATREPAASRPVLLGAPGSREELATVSRLASIGVGAMGLLSLAATALIHLGGLRDSLPDYEPFPVIALSLSAVAVAAAARVYPRLLSPATLPYLIPIGSLAVATVAYFASIEFSPYAAMFLAWTSATTTFLRLATAIRLMVWAGLLHAGVLVLQEGNASAFGRWQALTILMVTFAFAMYRLVERARSLVKGEAEARTDAEAARAAFEEVSAERSRFLASMSHQLRTPLNAIIGFSEVLAQRQVGELNEKQSDYVGDVVDSGRHLLALVDDLLDLGKVESGLLELHREHVVVAELVSSSASLFREQAARRHLTIEVDVDDVGSIEADARKIRQVLFNLLANAVKFTPPEERITVRARAHGDAVEIAVIDRGPGIDPGAQEAIFEEFAQADSPRGSATGTGLGLPLARRLVERHGGRLWVESDGRSGSTFVARIPRRPPDDSSASPSATAPSRRQRLILGEPDTPERRHETGRGMLVVGAGVVITAVISSLAFWLHPVAEFERTGSLPVFAGVAMFAAVVVAIIWWFPRQVGTPIVLPFFIPPLSVAYGLAAHAAGAVFSPYALAASIAITVAGALISKSLGYIAVGSATLMYAVVLAAQPATIGALPKWVLITGFASVTAMLHRAFVSRITVLAEAEREAREEADRVAQALVVASRHKTEFLANMSHELRTPLNAIIGFSEVLLNKAFGPLNPKQTEYVSDVITSGRHLLDLINDILDLAKVEAGRMELRAVPVDAAAAIARIADEHRADARQREVEVELVVDSAVGVIDLDEAKLSRTVSSLLSNAVRFAPPGTNVTLRASRPDSALEVIVSDSGPGIAPDEHERIFDAFTSTNPDAGSGLGLALARRYAELHGGHLTVTSVPGQGATFTLRVPVG